MISNVMADRARVIKAQQAIMKRLQLRTWADVANAYAKAALNVPEHIQ